MRVLQITDTHIRPIAGEHAYGGDTYVSLHAVLQDALAIAEPPEAIVATGDLADDGSEGSYVRLRRLLLETRLPVYVVPGNHDAVDAFDRALIGGPIRRLGTVMLGAWNVVFLNSNVPGKPFGLLADEELQRLERSLRERPDTATAIALHHPPKNRCSSSGCHLRNEDAFLNILAAHANARIVLAGHAHIEIDEQHKHTALLTAPASSSHCRHAPAGEAVDHEDFWASHTFDPDRRGYRMLTLRGDGTFESQVHWLSA